jgi:hypothetical protein
MKTLVKAHRRKGKIVHSHIRNVKGGKVRRVGKISELAEKSFNMTSKDKANELTRIRDENLNLWRGYKEDANPSILKYEQGLNARSRYDVNQYNLDAAIMERENAKNRIRDLLKQSSSSPDMSMFSQDDLSGKKRRKKENLDWVDDNPASHAKKHTTRAQAKALNKELGVDDNLDFDEIVKKMKDNKQRLSDTEYTYFRKEKAGEAALGAEEKAEAKELEYIDDEDEEL